MELYEKRYDELMKYQSKGYKDYPFITFIYGNQFRTLYEYIKNNINNQQNCKVKQLIQCVTNNKCRQFIQYKYQKQSDNIYEDMIQTINDYFIKLTTLNNIGLNDIYNNNIIKTDTLRKGIYIVSCSTMEYEKSVISWYIKLTGKTQWLRRSCFVVILQVSKR